MLFISGVNAFCPGFKPLCPILGLAGTPPSDCGTVGEGLMLLVRGLMLDVRPSDPLERHQVSMARLAMV